MFCTTYTQPHLLLSLLRGEVWVVAMWTWLYASRYLPGSLVAPAQVLGTFKKILGGRQPSEPPVLFFARAETLCVPQGAGRHPQHAAVRRAAQRLPHGQEEAAIFLRGILPHGLPRRDGLLCLLVFKKEIYVVNALFLCFNVCICVMFQFFL